MVKKASIFLGVVLSAVILTVSICVYKYRFFVESFINSKPGGVNVLILGKGGIGHDAPDLTDTIILAKISNQEISLISLPRDIWVPEIRAKINSAYYWGKQKDQGFKLVDQSVNTITATPPNYNVVIDFSVFKNIVDVLGGVKVEVKNSFTDSKYPIAGRENDLCNGDKTHACRYETVNFQKGIQIMDGDTALKFVRSRNAIGTEGTDFAREARQQQVISAIKSKMLSTEILFSPKKIKSLWKIAVGSVETDIPKGFLGTLVRMVFDARNNISSSVIPEELLTHPPTASRYDGQYVLIPKSGDWGEVQKWIQNLQN